MPNTRQVRQPQDTGRVRVDTHLHGSCCSWGPRVGAGRHSHNLHSVPEAARVQRTRTQSHTSGPVHTTPRHGKASAQGRRAPLAIRVIATSERGASHACHSHPALKGRPTGHEAPLTRSVSQRASPRAGGSCRPRVPSCALRDQHCQGPGHSSALAHGPDARPAPLKHWLQPAESLQTVSTASPVRYSEVCLSPMGF